MELPGKLYTMFHYNNKNRRVNLKICILHLINYHTSSVLEHNGPQAAATWRWCSRCCSPSPPPSTAPLTPATVLPTEGMPLASSDQRAAPGGSLLPPTTRACHPFWPHLLPTCRSSRKRTCAQTILVWRPEQLWAQTRAPAACVGSGGTDGRAFVSSAQSTG